MLIESKVVTAGSQSSHDFECLFVWFLQSWYVQRRKRCRHHFQHDVGPIGLLSLQRSHSNSRLES
jgi:hypothetical protein